MEEAFREPTRTSGMVDWDEFLVLFQDVKQGKVKGLGGMFRKR